MRNKARILPLLMRLGHAWLRHPDLRLGQLLTNAVGTSNLFHVEDEEMVKAAEDYCRDFNSDPLIFKKKP